jgi:hypothetical protein
VKLFLTPTIVCVALILRCPIYAQSVIVKPATTQSYGATQRGAPVLRRTKAYGGYELVVPGFADSPAVMDNPDGYLVRDRLEIAPGVEIRVPRVTEYWHGSDGYWYGSDGWKAKAEPPPPTVAVAGGQQHLEFGRFLADPQLWTHIMLNETTYELGRKYVSTGAYQFFGLAMAHGKAYLGVKWYTFGSDQEDWVSIVFRLDWNGKTVEPKPVRMIEQFHNQYPHMPLLLDTLPNGDLLLSESAHLWEMNGKEEFSALPEVTAVLQKNPNLAAYCMMWRRDRWLLIAHQRSNGKAIQFDIVAQNAQTGKKAREYSWSIRAN